MSLFEMVLYTWLIIAVVFILGLLVACGLMAIRGWLDGGLSHITPKGHQHTKGINKSMVIGSCFKEKIKYNIGGDWNKLIKYGKPFFWRIKK